MRFLKTFQNDLETKVCESFLTTMETIFQCAWKVLKSTQYCTGDPTLIGA